jgi:ribosomal protein L33
MRAIGKHSSPEIIQQIVNLACAEGKGSALIGAKDSMNKEHRLKLKKAGVLLGHAFSDSRGSNAFQECHTLIAGHSLLQNRGSLAREFKLATGVSVDPSYKDVEDINIDFSDYLRRRQEAEIIQLIGRVRHTRRPDEPLTIYFLGDIPESVLERYPGATIKRMHIAETFGYVPTPEENEQIVFWSRWRRVREQSQTTEEAWQKNKDSWGDLKEFNRLVDRFLERGSKFRRTKAQLIEDFEELYQKCLQGQEITLLDMLTLCRPEAQRRRVEGTFSKAHQGWSQKQSTGIDLIVRSFTDLLTGERTSPQLKAQQHQINELRKILEKEQVPKEHWFQALKDLGRACFDLTKVPDIIANFTNSYRTSSDPPF